MRSRSIVHIFLMCAASAVALSCIGGDRVIPPHKMAKIYVKMLLADQWVGGSKETLDMADTSLLYEPILAEYGYDKMDYVRSVNHYMDEPKTFNKIFDEVSDVLLKRIQEIEAAQKARERADSVRKKRSALDIRLPEPLMSILADSVRRDTVSIKMDSTGVMVWERIMPDTTFYGPRFVLKSYVDSLLGVRDSLTLKEDAGAVKSPETGKQDEVRKAEPAPVPVKMLPAPDMDGHGLNGLGGVRKITDIKAEPVLKKK